MCLYFLSIETFIAFALFVCSFHFIPTLVLPFLTLFLHGCVGARWMGGWWRGWDVWGVCVRECACVRASVFVCVCACAREQWRLIQCSKQLSTMTSTTSAQTPIPGLRSCRWARSRLRDGARVLPQRLTACSMPSAERTPLVSVCASWRISRGLLEFIDSILSFLSFFSADETFEQQVILTTSIASTLLM